MRKLLDSSGKSSYGDTLTLFEVLDSSSEVLDVAVGGVRGSFAGRNASPLRPVDFDIF